MLVYEWVSCNSVKVDLIEVEGGCKVRIVSLHPSLETLYIPLGRVKGRVSGA